MTIEKVALIKEKLKIAQSKQKSYANNHRQGLEFQVSDHVFLKVLPMKSVMRFERKKKGLSLICETVWNIRKNRHLGV